MTDKEIALIDLVIENDGGVSLAEMVGMTEFSKTTVHRNLENLTKRNLLHKSNGRYFLGAVMIRWMNSVCSERSLSRLFDPYLQQLLDKFNHTVHLVELQDSNKGVYIRKLQRTGAVQIKSNLGDELPLYSTGAGRAILTEFSDDEIEKYFKSIDVLPAMTSKTVVDKEEIITLIKEFKKHGFATEIEQNEDGIQCVGIAFSYGDVMLAISVVATTLEPVELLSEIGFELVAIKKQILADLL